MGASLKILIVSHDDSLQKLPISKYERLLLCDPKERMPEHAGKRVRYVLVLVEYRNRSPIGIIQKQYSYLTFDLDGHLCSSERQKVHRLALEALSDSPIARKSENIIDTKQIFAKNKLINYHLWTSNHAIERAIVNAIFKKT